MLLVILLRELQASGHELDITLGGPDAGGGLLLKRVQHIDGIRKPDRVHRSICVAFVRFDNFQHARTKSFPRFRRRCGAAELCEAQGVPHVALDRVREVEKITLG